MRTLTIPALLVSLLAGLPPSLGLSAGTAAAAQGSDYAFRFEAFFSGLRVGAAESRLQWGDGRYALQLHAQSTGLLNLFVTVDQLAASDGRLEGGPKAERHRNHNRTRNNWIDLRFTDDTVEVVGANPDPAGEQDRPAVPQALLKGSLDPLSAMLALGLTARTGERCDGSVPVFDGRRHDTHLEQQRAEVYTGPAGPAATLVCSFRFERRAGYTEEAKQWPGLTGSVWLQQLGDGLPLLPVRMEVETRYGTAFIHMVSADVKPAARGG